MKNSCFILLMILLQSSVTCGEEITSPRRAISTIPALTEIFYALGIEDRLVGVSKFCKYPPEVREKPTIGGFMDPDLEKILLLKPDWIGIFGRNERIENVVRPLGCHIENFRTDKLKDVRELILKVGITFEVEEKAGELVQSMSTEIEKIRSVVDKVPRKKFLYVIGRSPGSLQQLYAVGRHTFMDEILSLAGGDNCVEASFGDYPVLSREALIQQNPDVILDAGVTEQQYQEGKMPEEWEALASVKAVREKRVILVRDDQLTIPGPRIPESIRKLARLLHGETLSF